MTIEADCTCQSCGHDWEVAGPVSRAFGAGCPACDGYHISFENVSFTHESDVPMWVEEMPTTETPDETD